MEKAVTRRHQLLERRIVGGEYTLPVKKNWTLLSASISQWNPGHDSILTLCWTLSPSQDLVFIPLYLSVGILHDFSDCTQWTMNSYSYIPPFNLSPFPLGYYFSTVFNKDAQPFSSRGHIKHLYVKIHGIFISFQKCCEQRYNWIIAILAHGVGLVKPKGCNLSWQSNPKCCLP